MQNDKAKIKKKEPKVGDFEIIKQTGQARIGKLYTAHGVIETPAFLPCATYGNLRGVGQENLKNLGTKIILSNIYHLYLRPGIKTISDLGGIHKFMNWQEPIFTDSGGFQAFNLAKFAKVGPKGIEFTSHWDGSKHFFTPAKVIQIQQKVDVDIATCLDVCTGFPATESQVGRAVELTNNWAEDSIEHWKNNKMLLYGMVQGSIYKKQRQKSVDFLKGLPFSGFAIGGNMYTFGKNIKELAKEKPKMWETVAFTSSILPKAKPRHLLGVGEPIDIINGILNGIDTFDCVMTTRIARHGGFWIDNVSNYRNYRRESILTSKNSELSQPIDSSCGCFTCKSGYGRGFIRHLFKIKDPVGGRLLTFHNLYFINNLIKQLKIDLRARVDLSRI